MKVYDRWEVKDCGREYVVVHMGVYKVSGSGWNGRVNRMVPCMIGNSWVFGIHWLESNCATFRSWKVPHSSKNVSNLVVIHFLRKNA